MAKRTSGSKAKANKSQIAKIVAQRFTTSVASADQYSVTSYELTGDNNLIAPFETVNVEPYGATTWYTSGPPGAQATLILNRQQFTGGHNHPGGPVGTISPASFVLGPKYPQNQLSIFSAPGACGIVEVTLVQAGITRYNNVLRNGLVALGASTGITLTGSTPTHPANHWGTPSLVAGIQELARRFFQQFRKNIFVNDISLPTGGLFDHTASWAPPHQTHHDGRHVDVNWSSMSQTERAFFRTTAESLGFTVQIHPNPNHWHLIK